MVASSSAPDRVRVPICPHCEQPVKESPLTPGFAFCVQPNSKCRGAIFSIDRLAVKLVAVDTAGDERR